MRPITKSDFAEYQYGDIGRTGSVEASTLGLKPGEWPERFEVSGFGTFVLDQILRDGSHRYRVPLTLFTFTIWND